MQNDSLFKVLEEVCKEARVKIKYLQNDKYLAKLTNGEVTKYILNKQPNPNSGNALELAKDKQITYEILSHENINVVEYKLFWTLDNEIETENKFEKFFNLAYEFVKNEKFPIVIKPLNSSGGKDVYKIENLNDFKEIFLQYYLNQVKTYFNFVVNPFIDSEFEYRCIILNGEIELVYAKKRTTSWKHNLSEGAIPELNVSSDLKDKIADASKKACKIMELRYAGVDFLIDEFGQPIILEVNGSASLKIFSEFSEEHYDIVKNIYRKMILELFKD